MKRLKFLTRLVAIAVGVCLAIVILEPLPSWAWRLILIFLAAQVGTIQLIRGDVAVLRRDLARIQCQLAGHWPAEFKSRDDRGVCPHCGDDIAIRAIESAGPGMQYGDDTLHQRISRLEEAVERRGVIDSRNDGG